MTDAVIPLSIKPFILLADSQLLFLKEQDQPYIRRLHQLFVNKPVLCAAYIGASNGDQPEYFEMFQTAMQAIDVRDCRHIKADACEADLSYLQYADIILLAGGDIHQGWQSLSKLGRHLTNARKNGAVIIGTSAGAIQLGSIGWYNKQYLSNTDLFATFGFVPAIFSAHEEKHKWHSLQQLVTQTGGCLPGIGIPAGGGIIVSSDNSLQAIRKPMVNMRLEDNKVVQQSIWQLNLNEVSIA